MADATPNMRCPLCNNRLQTKDSRPAPYSRFGPSVRRRRYCSKCHFAMTTYEIGADTLVEMEAQLRASMRAVYEAHAALGVLIAAYEEIPDGSAASDGLPVSACPSQLGPARE